MTTVQTHIFYAGIILFSTALFWASENLHIGSFTIVKGNKIQKLFVSRFVFRISAFLVLTIPLVQRKCGTDTSVYYYDYIHDRIYDFDTLFCYLLKFIHRFIPEPQVGLGIISAVTIALSMISLMKLSKKIDPTLAFFAYVTCIYFYSYNYMRMLFALSFIFLGYSLCIAEKRKLAIIPFAIASFFHLSSLVVLGVHICLMYFKKHRALIITFSVLGLCAFLAKPDLFLSLITVERYSSQIVAGQQAAQVGVGTIIKALPLFYLIFKYYKKYKNDDRFTWLLVFGIANIIFSFLGYFVGTASRISNILLVFHIIYAVPLFIKEDELNKRKRAVRYGFIIYCILMYVLLTFNFDEMMINPYF